MAQTITPSMINEVMNCRKSVSTPEVGMLGTKYVGSDRYAVVVTKVFSPKKIEAVTLYDYDRYYSCYAKVKDGIEYLGPDGLKEVMENYKKTEYHNPYFIYTFRKNKRWIMAGLGMWETCSIHLGIADEYRDPCF